MNRKKRINQILKKKQKQMNSKLHKSSKPRYISKAEQAKLELEKTESENSSNSENSSDTENSTDTAPAE